jgi:hypothetical protein
VTNKSKQLTNPFSAGSGGAHFEAHVQASFVVLMLTGGFAPCLQTWPIKKIKLQGKKDGFDTDDLIVFVENDETKESCKLLGQVKHKITFTEKNPVLAEVIQAAWNDFSNPVLFNRDKDVIALITGPLSATDFHNVQWLLNQARHTSSADDFYKNVEKANFSPPKSNEKLNVIRHHLKRSNNNLEVSKDELYAFLKIFHLLGYDLGKETGVVLSLLNSHISQFVQKNPEWLWGRIVDVVQSWNQDAGTIVHNELPKDVIDAFKQRTYSHIPSELVVALSPPISTNWMQYTFAAELALVNLAGAWSDNNAADASFLSKLTSQSYTSLVEKTREMLHLPDAPISIRNGIWEIQERANLWDLLGKRIFDAHLDVFKSSIISVLRERDPVFELPQEKRYAASIYGKVLSHSSALRKGLAEGLALLGSRPEALVNYSQGNAGVIATHTIRDIFKNADWVLWGSLNDLLPALAESAPDEFLEIVEHAVASSPSPFVELFKQEGDGMTGRNYLTGLFWALEGLAWDEKCLVRVCVILGGLANVDPGGKWANRPINSLATILLPWLPQTTATVDKRKVAVKALIREYPSIGWTLILKLLPNHHQTSMGTYKPLWRQTIPDDWGKNIPHEEYWAQVSFYAELAVSMAEQDVVKLVQLVDYFDRLPKPSFERLRDILSSKGILEKPEEERRLLWEKLTKFTAKHRRFPDAKWTLGDELLSPLEEISEKLSPATPLKLYPYLFSNRGLDLYDGQGGWEEQENKLQNRRQSAISEILSQGGIDAVISFVDDVEEPTYVGQALGFVANTEIDQVLLPAYLGLESRKLSNFISAYIWIRHYINGWLWADEVNKSEWKSQQIAQFLISLPFTRDAWNRAENWLGSNERIYWLGTTANFYNAKDDFGIAIDKLIEYGRPHAAINGLYKKLLDKQDIDANQCIKVLRAVGTSSEPSSSMDEYQIVELIKMLQDSSEIVSDDLLTIEWTYLQLLDGHNSEGVTPKQLEESLASDPEFFCQMIRLIYKSNKNNSVGASVTEKEKSLAMNAWHLFEGWKVPPGMQKDGVFDGTKFLSWLERVKESCTESGHLEVALERVGKILFHCPPDPDGLWINHVAANALNEKDSEDMRNGFSTAVFNSRGAHWVDPTGKPELQLAEQYEEKAEKIENHGYHRFAVTLRELAKGYKMQAERVVARYMKNGE